MSSGNAWCQSRRHALALLHRALCRWLMHTHRLACSGCVRQAVLGCAPELWILRWSRVPYPCVPGAFAPLPPSWLGRLACRGFGACLPSSVNNQSTTRPAAPNGDESQKVQKVHHETSRSNRSGPHTHQRVDSSRSGSFASCFSIRYTAASVHSGCAAFHAVKPSCCGSTRFAHSCTNVRTCAAVGVPRP